MTDTPNKYRDAREWCDRVEVLAAAISADHEFTRCLPAIREALAFTEKALGEPSEGVIHAAKGWPYAKQHFKAMIQQCWKEVRS